MSVTAWGASVMMATALGAAELPAWLPGAQWNSPWPPVNTIIIVPAKACPPSFEVSGSRCVPDCSQGLCKRVRLAGEQTRFYGPRGESLGTATPDGSGGFVYRNPRGETLGRSSSEPSTGAKRYWNDRGRSLGTSDGPPARMPFLERR
jgi:hypothetical protein